MNTSFEYKGYIGSAEVDTENSVLVGRLLFIRDNIAYSGRTIEELESAFREAVDDYLKLCSDSGDEPDAPCKGTFNVRVGAQRHREIAMLARRKGVSLNDLVCSALDEAVRAATPGANTQTVIHRHVITVGGEPKQLVATTSAAPQWEILDGNAKH